MKKYRCPNCKEVFIGTQEICPKCGVKLHYANQQKDKPVVEEATTVSNFSFNDPDVIKHEEKFVPVTSIESLDGPNGEGQDAVQAPLGMQGQMFGPAGESFFDGKAINRVGVYLAALLVFIITIGFGFAWSVCYVYRWETTHCVIQGHRMKFTGKAKQIFGRYLLWLLLIPLTLGIIFIYIQIFLRKWRIKHTEFAD